MSVELEAAAIDSHRHFFRRKPPHVRPPGSPCPNCDAVLQGPWCHQCGQSAEELHRNVLHLAAEAFEGLTHFDGRFWRTLPPLLLKPGKLTRDYIEGHRASQIPPLRLFLVALLLVFFTGSFAKAPLAVINRTDGQGRPIAATRTIGSLKDLTLAERAEFDKSLSGIKFEFNGKRDQAASSWVNSRVRAAVSDPERFKLILEAWAERFAFLMLPVAALLLSALFVFQRRFYVFDHTIFALHSLAFQGLLISLVLVLRPVSRFFEVLYFAAPVHLFLHMRGVYGTGVIGTAIRMMLLFVGSVFGFSLLVLGLLWVVLSAMGGE